MSQEYDTVIFNDSFSFTARLRFDEDIEALTSESMTIAGNAELTGDAVISLYSVEGFYSHAEWLEIKNIIFDFTKDIFLTPPRKYLNVDNVDSKKVIVVGTPEKKQILQDNGITKDVTYHVQIDFKEVRFD